MTKPSLRSFRLNSLDEPTDDMLHAIMEQVGEAAKESTKRAKQTLQRMFEETDAEIRALKALQS